MEIFFLGDGLFLGENKYSFEKIRDSAKKKRITITVTFRTFSTTDASQRKSKFIEVEQKQEEHVLTQ